MSLSQTLWSNYLMHSRYHAPNAERIWSDQSRIRRMREISDLYTINAIEADLLKPYQLRGHNGVQTIQRAEDPTVGEWRAGEDLYGHEIVGFLEAYLDRLPRDLHPFVHYGLTSSDLTEYDLHVACADHAGQMYGLLGVLIDVLTKQQADHSGLVRAGRTHGQTAEVTSHWHQINVFVRVFEDMRILTNQFAKNIPLKTPGPVGSSTLRQPPFIPRTYEVPSTQIIPRDWLLAWATAYLRISNQLETLAMFVRLGARSEIGEFREGKSISRQGSSAMPGKTNPIDSEKVCGLARVVRGLVFSIAEVSALWEERDLSNSSTERIAIPDLAAVTEHMLQTMIEVMEQLVIDVDRVRQNTKDPRTRTSSNQAETQRTRGIGPIEASRRVQSEMEKAK